MKTKKAPKLTTETTDAVTTVSLGDHSVKIYEESPTKHRVTWYVGSKRMRRAYPSGEDALAAAEDILSQFAEGRAELTKTPAQKIEHFLQLEQAVYPATLDDAVHFYLGRKSRTIKPRTTKEVVDEMIVVKQAAKERKSTSSRWVNSLKYRLGKFTKRFACPIGNITGAEMEAFLLDPKHKWSERTRFNIQQTVTGLFNFAARKGYLEKDGSPMDKIERLGSPASDPKVFPPTHLERLLRLASATKPELVPYIAIGAFAGLRSAEISRLTWEDHIDFDEGAIRLPSGITKTSRRRTVTMHPTLLQWLLPSKGKKGKVAPYYNMHKFTHKLAVAAKVPWVQNGLRHSCISYGMALNPNAHYWAEQSGHSVAVLQTSYKQLVTLKDAEQWFKTFKISLDDSKR